MTLQPAGILPAGFISRLGPAPALYFSALTAPTRAVCFLTEFDVDTVTTESATYPPMVAGVFNCVQTITVDRTALARATRRYATRKLLTSTADAPALTVIEPRLAPVDIRRRIDAGIDGAFGSTATASAGQVLLSNEDGALDELDDGVAVIGRNIRVSVAALDSDGEVIGESVPDVLATAAGTVLVTDKGKRLSIGTSSTTAVLPAFGEIFSGVVEATEWSRNRVQLTIKDYRLRLAQPIQTEVYTGLGGSGGHEGLAGVTKPLTFGRCRNVRPVLVDPVRQIYQFHDGEARAVDIVRDSGVRLTRHGTVKTYAELEALEPPSSEGDGDFPLGTWVAAPFAGCFRLAGQPAGAVTADVRGSGGADELVETFTDGTYTSDGKGITVGATKIHARSCAGIIQRLLIDYAEMTTTEVQVSAFAQITRELPHPGGLYLPAGDTTTIATAIGALAQSIGCVLLRGRDGRYTLRKLAPPNPTPLMRVDNKMLDEQSLVRLSLPYRQPWGTIEVTYRRNWTPMSETDLVEATRPDERPWLLRDTAVWRETDERLTTIYPERGPLRIDSLLVNASDAEEVATRLQTVYAHGRAQYKANLRGVSYRLDLGDTIRLTSNRYGLSAGAQLMVTGISENGVSRATEVELFG